MQDDSRDAYTEVGGRATQDAKAEGGGRERPEHVLEVENVGNTFSRAMSGTIAEVEQCRDTYMDVSGRVESGRL